MKPNDLNRFFIIEFRPINPKMFFRNRNKSAIGGGQLVKYIGEKGALRVLKYAKKSLKENVPIKIQNIGLIKLYYR